MNTTNLPHTAPRTTTRARTTPKRSAGSTIQCLAADEQSTPVEQLEEKENDDETVFSVTENGILVGDTVFIPSANADFHQWLPKPENIPLHPSIVAFGKRRTGKSTTIKNVAFWAMQDLDFGIILSNTAFAGAWDDVHPKRWTFQGLREDIINALVARQKRLISMLGKEDPRTFAYCIMDDVIADQRAIRWTPGLQSFFVEGRHLNVTVIITSQNVKGVGPLIRRNVDYAFIQPIRMLPELDALYDLFGGAHFDKRTWRAFNKEIVMQRTLPGSTAAEPKKVVRVMVIANFEVSNTPQDQFFWWVPRPMSELPPFRLMHDVYWQDNEELQSSERKLNRPDPVEELEQVNSVLQDVPMI